MKLTNQKKAIIIGATSGIGRELAISLISKNYLVGITGRRTENLNEIQHSANSSWQIFHHLPWPLGHG